MDQKNHFIGRGCHSRSLKVNSEENLCFECKEKKHVLLFDNSDEEYTTIRFCIECLTKFVNGYVSESKRTNDYEEF